MAETYAQRPSELAGGRFSLHSQENMNVWIEESI